MSMKALLRISAIVVVLIVLFPLQWLTLRFGRRPAIRIPMMFHRAVLAILGLRVAMRGTMSERTPHFVVANHVSWLDIIVIGAMVPVCFIAKSEINGWPFIGALARLQRTVFVDRGRRAATGGLNEEIGERLRQGDRMLLFGEGTTSDGIHLLPFRSSLLGATRSALEGRPDALMIVQPLALAFTRRGGLPLDRRGMPGIAWPGDVALGPHALGILSGPPIDAVLSWGEAITVQAGANRKHLTQEVEADIRRLVETARRSSDY